MQFPAAAYFEEPYHVFHPSVAKASVLPNAYFLRFQMTEKKVKAKTSAPAPDDTYPEIEKFFPFNPIGNICECSRVGGGLLVWSWA